MKRIYVLATAFAAVASTGVIAQEVTSSGLGEVIVTSNRQNAPYAQNERPVIGHRKRADSVVMQVSISSDSRDASVRKREIHAVLLSVIDRAAAAGVEIVTGNFELIPVTKANYQTLPLYNAGRVDTDRVLIMAKTKLAGTASDTEKRIDAFVKGISGSGRGVIEKAGGLILTIVNPDQYRDSIVKRIADNARQNAAMFGPDYAVQVSGIDGQVSWSQVSDTDVFLYIPYRFTIVPK